MDWPIKNQGPWQANGHCRSLKEEEALRDNYEQTQRTAGFIIHNDGSESKFIAVYFHN